MTRERILVLADDLTGAAEIAAIGHCHGLRTALVLGLSVPSAEADLLVVDTNSRLLSDALAAQRVRQALGIVTPAFRTHVFKKTDSVLRGPIAAELQAAWTALGKSGALLCACNPSRGRIVKDGRYSIEGVPLHKTGFATDPFHPAKTDEVVELVGGNSQVLPAGFAQIPTQGLLLGEASTAADMDHWAGRIPECLLFAGGADAFAAFLRKLGFSEKSPLPGALPPSPHLLLSGSLAPSSRAARAKARKRGLACAEAPVGILTHNLSTEYIHAWAENADDLLDTRGSVLVCADSISPGTPGSGPQVRRSFQQLAHILGTEQSFNHLLAEGGDVAACAAESLGWDQLFVEKLWAPGVVTLRPRQNPNLFFTIKPGSYEWPPEIWNLLLNAKTHSHS